MSISAFISLLAPLLAPHNLIMSEQNGTRPAKPFATVSVRSIRPARATESVPDGVGEIDIWEHRANTVEIQVFGDNASDIASLLALKLRYPSTADRAESLNIGISNITSVLRVPELLNTSQFEERAILEFTAYDLLLGSDNVGLIENVELDCFEHTHIISSPTVVTDPEG